MSDLENELLGLAEDEPRRKRKGKNAPKGKSSAYVDSSESEGEMDMDLESEEGEGDDIAPPKPISSSKPVSAAPQIRTNPYPLEGKYIDEDDRDRLEDMPEFEREAILAGRLEEMQKYKDSQQLEAMYRMAGMGGAEEEDEDEPSRKKRKHTSVTKEASRAMKDLKNKRKAMDERAQRRAERRAARQRDASDSEDEDGEISNSFDREDDRERERDRDYDHDYRQSRDRSPAAAGRKRSPRAPDLDQQPPDAADINGARVSRYELVEMMYKEGFEEVVKGSYVRLITGDRDEWGRPKYRVYRIEDIQRRSNEKYEIEYKGRQVVEDWQMLCSYGRMKRQFRIADVSNGDVEESEFRRSVATAQVDGTKTAKRSELMRKHEAIKALRDREMTNTEIDRQVAARKAANPAAQMARAVFDISQVVASRRLAQRRGDVDAIEAMNRQIVALGGDPETGELVMEPIGSQASVGASGSGNGSGNGSAGGSQGKNGQSHHSHGGNQGGDDPMDHDARIERINELKRERVKGNMEKAHKGAVARRKAEEALIKAKELAAAEAAAGVNVLATPSGEPIPIVKPPTGGIKKGETPQQYIARTVELDLGDF